MKCIIKINNDSKDPANIGRTFMAEVEDKGMTATVRPNTGDERIYMNKITDPTRGFEIVGIFNDQEYVDKETLDEALIR